ncbi:MAG: DMT family transporter [Lentisphaeria bacterium]|nr:DMT family transporter [Lentisphaeria bacterium]
MMSDRIKGCVVAAVGAAAYGLNPLFSLPLYEAGFSPVNALFYRFFLAGAIVGAMIRRQGGRLRPEPGTGWALCGAAALMIGSSLTLFYAYNYMASGIVSTLLFVYPVAVASMMTLFFKEKPSLGVGIGVVLSLAGVAVLAGGDCDRPFDWRGLTLSLASALFYSFFIVMVRVSRLRQVSAEKISFYAMILGAGLFLLLSFCTSGLPVPRTPRTVGCALLLALLPTVVALVLTSRAIQIIGATPAAVFGALEPVVAVLCGIGFFHEKFTLAIAAGVVLIVISVMLTVFSSSTRAVPPR